MSNLKIYTLILATFVAVLFAPTLVFAWDFTCSPKTESTVKVAPPPKLMMMLDRSGSMRNGEQVNTCRVCEHDGDEFKVSDKAECLDLNAWEATGASNLPSSTGSGGSHLFVLSQVPQGAELNLELDLFGDFGGQCESVTVEVSGVVDIDFNFFPPPYIGQPSCRAANTNFAIPSWLTGPSGELVVRITRSSDNNRCTGGPSPACRFTSTCDGVDLNCAENSAKVSLTTLPFTYLGSKTDKDVCGSNNKWEQAIEAIDRLTAVSDAANPQLGSFGLGWFSGSSASLIQECLPSNNVPIVTSLNGTSPSGSTPTGKAIETALNSDCISGTTTTAFQTASYPMDNSNEGYDYGFVYTGIPTQTGDMTLDIRLWGDFRDVCEIAEIRADGQNLGYMTDIVDCSNAGFTQSFTVPASLADDGEVKIEIDTRAQGEATAFPTCASGSAGVEAGCSQNQANVSLTYVPSVRSTSATMLINDGEPTVGGSYSSDAYTDGIGAACAHRHVAPLYVVGLGTGTDNDYNNIMAAAGGTGTCRAAASGSLDPCDDISDWADFRGLCTGSYAAGDGDALISAMAEIAASLNCTFPISFLGSAVTEVPDDPTNEYPYLYVDVFESSTASVVRLYHKDSSAAAGGEGWDFSNPLSRTQVTLTDGYCELAAKQEVQIVATQLACLCEQTAGQDCSVPNADALLLCPDGVWACNEGIDYCEPEANCCVPDEPCDTGQEGVCGPGTMFCDGSPRGICVGSVGPSAEICDNLDNNCDGQIDENVERDCATGEPGRCADGHEVCTAGVWASCTRRKEPMPEQCNGLDDDCDGQNDNISASWDKPEFATFTVPQSQIAQVCNFANTCMCASGPDTMHRGDDFTEYLDEWTAACLCGEGLSESTPEQSPEPAGDAASGAQGCSTIPGQDSPLPFSVFIALMALGIKRRREP